MEWSFLFFLNSALLGVGLAMDAFSVSMANGLHDPGMSRKRMCIIAGTFGVFQAVMPMTGWVCVHTIVEMFSSFETFIPWIALALLGYIGGKMLIDGIRGEETEEAAALNSVPALGTNLMPVASGKLVQSNSKAAIDYSNTTDGYVMVKFIASSATKIKAQVKGPTTTYTYNLTAGASDWTTFPLSDGNGSYTVTVYENLYSTKYSAVCSVSFNAAMTDSFAPFLRPNQYVDYTTAPNTIAKAAELTGGISDPLEKVKAVYSFVVTNFTYDKQKAANVQSGYLPVLDTVLA